MKKILFVSVVLVLLASLPVYGDSLVRVQCEDEDVGAEVFLNDKFVGECPMDASVKEGTLQLRARKIVDNDHEKIFEKKIRVVEGVSQRVELVMSASQLTAEARQRKAVAEVTAQLKAAEAGDIEAMKQLAERYDTGSGVKKDPAQAAIWRDMAESATAQEELRAANAGDIEAMKNIAGRYDTGLGVVKDHSQAQLWRERAQSARLEQTKQEKAAAADQRSRENEAKAESISYFKNTSELVKTNTGDGPLRALISSVPATAFGLFSDLLSAPSVTSQKSKFRNAAALRPSTWGRPDSMIAQAARQYKTSSFTEKTPLLVAAAK